MRERVLLLQAKKRGSRKPKRVGKIKKQKYYEKIFKFFQKERSGYCCQH